MKGRGKKEEEEGNYWRRRTLTQKTRDYGNYQGSKHFSLCSILAQIGNTCLSSEVLHLCPSKSRRKMQVMCSSSHVLAGGPCYLIQCSFRALLDVEVTMWLIDNTRCHASMGKKLLWHSKFRKRKVSVFNVLLRKSKAAFLCIHSSNEQIIIIPISTRIICFQCSSPMETTFSNGYDTHRVN